MLRKVFGVSRRLLRKIFSSSQKINILVGENVLWPQKYNIENHGNEEAITIGNNNEFSDDFHIRCYEKGKVMIGDFNWTSLRTQIVCANRVEIGSFCMFGRDVYISDTNEHPVDPVERLNSTKIFWSERVVNRYHLVDNAPVVIADNVWLGERVIILKGVSIGKNSVVAAGSVVTKSIPENCVAAGNPAKVIKVLIKE